MENGIPVLLTIDLVKAVLHQSRSTLYRKIQRGELRAFRLANTGRSAGARSPPVKEEYRRRDRSAGAR